MLLHYCIIGGRVELGGEGEGGRQVRGVPVFLTIFMKQSYTLECTVITNLH